jgi:hypothetical protein
MKLSERLAEHAKKTKARADWAYIEVRNRVRSQDEADEWRQFADDLAEAVALARRVEAEPTCSWVYDDGDCKWDAACGAAWSFTEGGPTDNDMNHCHNCGKRVAIVPIEVNDERD